MTPDAFSFTLTVPGDDRLLGVVRDLCVHAAGYAQIPESVCAPFCDRVVAAAAAAVGRDAGAPCAMQFACEGGELRVTIDGQTITQPVVA